MMIEDIERTLEMTREEIAEADSTYLAYRATQKANTHDEALILWFLAMFIKVMEQSKER